MEPPNEEHVVTSCFVHYIERLSSSQRSCKKLLPYGPVLCREAVLSSRVLFRYIFQDMELHLAVQVGVQLEYRIVFTDN